MLLHATLRIPLQAEGRRGLELAQTENDFRWEVEATLDALSAPDEFGIQVMSKAQAGLVRDLLAQVPAGASC